MQSIRNAILWHVRAKRPTQTLKLVSTNQMCTTTAKARYTDDDDDDQTMDRVIGLVKKFDKIDASKASSNRTLITVSLSQNEDIKKKKKKMLGFDRLPRQPISRRT